LFKLLQSWKYDGTALATELAPEFVDAEPAIESLALQDAKGNEATCQMMDLRPLRARLTARQPELILTDADQFLNLRAYTVPLPHLHGRQRQAIGGVVLFAVSDNEYFEAAAQPADLGPGGGPPMVPHRMSIEAAILLEATDKIPAIVATPFQERFGRIPRIKEDVCRATAQAMAGLAE
jgi:hypothetical protein